MPLAEMAGQLPHTRLVYVVDQESDIMALMVRARSGWCVRAICTHPWTGCCAADISAP